MVISRTSWHLLAAQRHMVLIGSLIGLCKWAGAEISAGHCPSGVCGVLLGNVRARGRWRLPARRNTAHGSRALHKRRNDWIHVGLNRQIQAPHALKTTTQQAIENAWAPLFIGPITLVHSTHESRHFFSNLMLNSSFQTWYMSPSVCAQQRFHGRVFTLSWSAKKYRRERMSIWKLMAWRIHRGWGIEAAPSESTRSGVRRLGRNWHPPSMYQLHSHGF